MKQLISVFAAILTTNIVLGQPGWVHDTNPLSDISAYTTTNAYVGASFVELNGDNFVDIFAPPKTIFLNNGNGTYSAALPLTYTSLNPTSGSSCADLDNDGDNDLILSGVPSFVYFNNGLGGWHDSSHRLPGFVVYGSFGVAIGDFNKDALLDFTFAHANGFLTPSTPSPCKLYKQQTPIFNPIEVSGYPFTTGLDAYTVPYWSDYDLDGDMDLFVASGPADGTSDYDYCYKNLKVETGNDTLVAMTAELFATQTQDGQCYNFIDYDNDGDLDLCLTNYYGAATRLYNNTGGAYTSVTTPFTFAATNLSNCWGDYDNDGDLDVIITNDNQISKYYRNNGDGTFTYLSDGFATPTATCGIANGDYDNDGDLDIFINGVGNNGTTASVGLYVNQDVAADRQFVNFKLEGIASNRSAIGAIVRIKATIGGTPVWQMREVNAQNTFQGQNDLRVHFGLNDATNIDSIIVRWPSGVVEYFENYEPGFFYHIKEGVGVNTLSVAAKKAVVSVAVHPNPATDKLYLTVNSRLANEGWSYVIDDIWGQIHMKGAVSNPETAINISLLPPGVYFVGVSNGDVVRFLKR